MADAPAPLTPPECDLRGLAFMPLDVVRLMDSDLFALTTGDEFKAAVALWCKSWLQVPAASLPNDERVLAFLSGAGPKWRRVRDVALRGWVLCSDGRLYHPVVAEKAITAFTHRLKQRSRVKARWKSQPETVLSDAIEGASQKTIRGIRMAAAREKATHTPEEWTALVSACGSMCLSCRAVGRLEKDHIVPLYQGGSDGIENLQPLCPSCNTRKGADNKDLRPIDWKEKMLSALHTGRIQGRGRGTVESPDSSLRSESARPADRAPVQGALILPMVGGGEPPPADESVGERVRREQGGEARLILRRLAPALAPARMGEMLGAWCKHLNGDRAALLHVLRDAERHAAQERIVGDPIRWLWGLVRQRASASNTGASHEQFGRPAERRTYGEGGSDAIRRAVLAAVPELAGGMEGD